MNLSKKFLATVSICVAHAHVKYPVLLRVNCSFTIPFSSSEVESSTWYEVFKCCETWPVVNYRLYVIKPCEIRKLQQDRKFRSDGIRWWFPQVGACEYSRCLCEDFLPALCIDLDTLKARNAICLNGRFPTESSERSDLHNMNCSGWYCIVLRWGSRKLV